MSYNSGQKKFLGAAILLAIFLAVAVSVDNKVPTTPQQTSQAQKPTPTQTQRTIAVLHRLGAGKVVPRDTFKDALEDPMAGGLFDFRKIEWAARELDPNDPARMQRAIMNMLHSDNMGTVYTGSPDNVPLQLRPKTTQPSTRPVKIATAPANWPADPEVEAKLPEN